MKQIFCIGLALLISVLAGCAAPGSIVPNTTSADELVSKLGKPSDVRRNPQGGEFWDYVYGPEGITTWRYAIDSKRMVRSADQLITYERLYKVVPGVTTEAGVLELLGRPRLTTRYSHETAWEWRVSLTGEMGIFVVRFTHDGIALGVSVQKDIYIDGDRGNP
jgi:outer membrane protein assembly factor BamE (lipoprotein component of BamABCDE complex)